MKLLRSFYFWIFAAFIGGCLLGWFNPPMGASMEPLATGFVKLIKLFVGPVVFLTVVTGIAQTGSLKKLGALGLRAFIYFEVISTLALGIGWLAAHVLQPGAGVQASLEQLDAKAVSQFIASSEKLSTVDFLKHIIPASIVEPFASGDMLQILFLAILFGASLLAAGERVARPLCDMLERLASAVFVMVRMVLMTAPLGIFGAMAFTVGRFGSALLLPLAGLIGVFYLTAFVFVAGVLGTVARCSGFSLVRFLRFILPELWLVLGTSSSEAALPQLIQKLEALGCERETVGVIVPMGYSFNLDGTNIYITLAALFIAQALGISLSATQQIALLATAMLTSKGAAGVTGAGFVTLAATLAVVPAIPTVGIVLVLGIDRFMSDVRALVNYIGNGVATLAISRYQREVSAHDLQRALSGHALERAVTVAD